MDCVHFQDKENLGQDLCVKSKFNPNSSIPMKDSGNVTVTLTLTSSAAENILGVLRDLANILHIPPPTSYQIVERTTTPPSQKLGLYRTKGKDGKEGGKLNASHWPLFLFRLLRFVVFKVNSRVKIVS